MTCEVWLKSRQSALAMPAEVAALVAAREAQDPTLEARAHLSLAEVYGAREALPLALEHAARVRVAVAEDEREDDDATEARDRAQHRLHLAAPERGLGPRVADRPDLSLSSRLPSLRAALVNLFSTLLEDLAFVARSAPPPGSPGGARPSRPQPSTAPPAPPPRTAAAAESGSARTGSGAATRRPRARQPRR